MPTSSRQRSTVSGAAATSTPSASNRSALPQALDTERLPCLAMRTPDAASTSAASDDTLSVRCRSPPVPQVSNTSSYVRASGREAARIAVAKPTISDGRSPFITRPTSSPAIWAGVARPAMISAIAADASSAVRSRRNCSLSISAVNIYNSRKLRSIRRPAGVNTDSGWNCTPCTGSSRCRKPMTVPSSAARAVISNASGQPSSLTQREW